MKLHQRQSMSDETLSVDGGGYFNVCTEYNQHINEFYY